MSLTHDFVDAVTAVASRKPNEATVEAARKALIDTIACMMAGAPQPSIQILRRLAVRGGGTGGSSAIGRGSPLDPRTAALINGTAGHALDYDDVLLLMPGHPSVAVLPAVLAIAEEIGSTGAELLYAYIDGVEICGRFSEAVRVTHYKRGWHATGTLGAFGALAGVAILLKLDASALTNALGILTSLLGGVQRNFGTMTKPLHAGQGAANAVWAALAAREGFTADPQILESPGGFYDVFNGAVPANLDSLSRALAPNSVFEEPGLALKRFPCNYALHRNVDAFVETLQANGVAVSDIDKVECLLPPGETRPIMRARPETGLEAKFSLEYVLAAQAIDGGLSFESFTDAAVARPEIRAFLEKIEKRESPACASAPGAKMQDGIGQGFTRVIVHTRDGRSFSTDRAYPRGAPEDPMTWDDVAEKFRICARHGGISGDAAAQLFEWLRSIEHQPSLNVLSAALRQELPA